jgi:hypothetical protein
MTNMLSRCLDDLSARLDEQVERTNTDQWLAFLNDRFSGNIFTPSGRPPREPKVQWPKVSINQAIADPESMLLREFGNISAALARGAGFRLTVRCNYGTGILPTLFGCKLYMMEEALNTLPTALPMGRERMRALLDEGVPDVRAGLGEAAFDTAERFLEVFERYPNIGRHVALYHPDAQGPIDVLELVWGSDMFYAFYNDDTTLRDMLNLVTDTFIDFISKWHDMVGWPEGYASHWGLLHKGGVTIRNDSLMNLSPQMYVDFIRPMDQRILDKFGGGIIHFCGRGDHFIEEMSKMRGLTGIAMSQPHLNDMDSIYRNTVDKGIKLLMFKRSAAMEALAKGRHFGGQMHCE